MSLTPEADIGLSLTPSPVEGGAISGVEASGEETSGDVSGATAGDQGSDQAGDSLLAGSLAGYQTSLSDWGMSGQTAGEFAGELAGERVDDLCGSTRCHPDAYCVSDPGGVQCECAPLYEGDGVECAPQPCPSGASGAPYCQCDDGYQGELYYEYTAREWLGRCDPVNSCVLRLITASEFVSLDRDEGDVSDTVGLRDQELYTACIPREGGVDRYTYSMNEGVIYVSRSVEESESGEGDSSESADTCEGASMIQQTAVDFWAYSGGVVNERNLYHLPMQNFTLESCEYQVLIVIDDGQVSRVYFAPSGVSCDRGARESVSCGVGSCRVSGEVVCVDGEWSDECHPIEPSADPDLCDFIDSDCDGVVDEAFESEETQCGVGACRSTGVTSCAFGQVSDSCVMLQPTGADLTCDDTDDDCDGEVDEGYATRPISCGEGVCQADGVVLCESGVEVTRCEPLDATGDDADCDLVDQDCDGVADEGYQGVPVTCGVGACLFDGFTRCINGAPEEACTPLSPAENDASCDGVDDDCDGRVDEDVEDSVIFCGAGYCATSGVRTCVDGEIIDRCTPRDPLGADESCDGVDEDCDGLVDEHFESAPIPCSGAGVYACAVTAPLVCAQGRASFDCGSALAVVSDTTCDGLDDDCDGQLDEDYEPVEVSCGLGECADTSITRCVEGAVTDRCLVRAPTGDDADCDGRDDDCDGEVDESFVERQVTCGLGLCTSTGALRCVEGAPVSECVSSSPANPDEQACDGLDNDCDGRVDERFASARTACGDGVCAAIGSSSCADGVVADNCTPLPSTGDDADCDGIDQDCDASTDESYPPVIDACGQGVCYNTAPSSCVAGEVQNNCVPLPEQGDDSRCDGIDQDCDGRVDEAYQPVPTTCTYGSVCVQDGLTECINGSVVSVCDPPAFYTGSDNSCNLQDNDCDGRVDEGFVGGVFYCGSGVCRGSGNRSCINGVEAGGECTTSNPTGGDNNCNGVDEDCDGRSDEHYGTYNTSCGRGVCARNGTETCRNGSISSTCSPGPPQGDDSDTNGRDDDCDGRVDEDSIPPETNCNGLDDDFDGRVDEGYGVSNTTCGSGACARTGTRYCESGQVINTCVPGGSVDNDCDGQDEDCDGSTDEHYSGGGTTCGVGACASTGARICQGGSVVNTCNAGSPGNEILGNSVDDDCDGTTDEGAVREPVGSSLVRCDFGGGRWYTRQLVSSGWMFYSAGLVCYRSQGFIYDATGYTFIDGTPRAPGTGECVNACR